MHSGHLLESSAVSARLRAHLSFRQVTSVGVAERIVALLSDGGEIFMPMKKTFFEFRVAMLRDKFGTSWMIINERTPPRSA